MNIEIEHHTVRAILQFGGYLLVIAILGASMFLLTGRDDLPTYWTYLGVLVLVAIATALFVSDQGLAEERRNPGKGGIDWSIPKIGPWFLFAHVVVASLDVGRLHWSNIVPLWLQIAGLMGFGLSLALLIWSMSVNRFFSPVVRIQSERGHHVVTAGPYRYVRHPGYSAMLLLGPASCLALGSLWAFVPVVAWMLLIIRRTAIEDRVLRESLDGYREYAGRVRYRVAPRFW